MGRGRRRKFCRMEEWSDEAYLESRETEGERGRARDNKEGRKEERKTNKDRVNGLEKWGNEKKRKGMNGRKKGRCGYENNGREQEEARRKGRTERRKKG